MGGVVDLGDVVGPEAVVPEAEPSAPAEEAPASPEAAPEEPAAPRDLPEEPGSDGGTEESPAPEGKP